MPSAEALSCPKCGATADPNASHCAFCAARLATVACPACFARFFQGFSNCPYCGTDAERSPLARSKRTCPKCEGKPRLVQVKLGGMLLEECARCAGFWLSHKDFERLQADREEHVAILGMPAPEKPLPAEQVRYWPCPECNALMNRVNFARISGVILDSCRKDGVWFDADELRRIVAFIQEGGLSRAREREVERLRDEHAALQSKLRDAQWEQQRDQGRATYGNPWSRETPLERLMGGMSALLRAFMG
jgi:Zn-finger nucleic acid-binding protein